MGVAWDGSAARKETTMAHRIHRSTFGILALALVGLAGCLQQDTESTPPPKEEAEVPPPPTEETEVPPPENEGSSPEDGLSEAEVVGVVSNMYRAQINLGQAALGIVRNAEVQAYAQRMVEEKQRAEAFFAILIAEAGLASDESNLALFIETWGEEANERLRNLAASEDPDREYVQAQLANHQRAVAILDGWLIPRVHTPDLRSYLQAVRILEQAHAEEAQRLRSLLPPEG